MQLIEIADVAQIQGRKVGVESRGVDLGNEGLALGGVGDVAVAEDRGQQVADAVDLPDGILVVEGTAGAQLGVEADFAQRAEIAAGLAPVVSE